MHPAPRAVAPGSLEQRPVTALKGVGEALAARLAVLGVHQVQDLLFVLPSRYEDRTRVMPIGALQVGTRAVVEGEVQLTEVIYRRRRQMLCRIADGSGFLTLRFFYFTGAQQQGLARGTRIRCFGEARRGPLGMEMVHPEYRRVLATYLANLEPEIVEVPAVEGRIVAEDLAKVLATTNLTTPTGTWISLGTGSFNASGVSTNTLTVNGNEPAQFFRLQQP